MIRALSIAGFDGSAGAGVLADIKTMDFFDVYGEAVCTALTVQSENEFVNPGWIDWEKIKLQLETLYKSYTFKFVKIGLIENAEVLKRIITFVREKSPDAYIIWDPVASASAGYKFFKSIELDDFIPLMKQVDLITPNQDEFALFEFGLSASRGEIELGKDFSILLKGAHSNGTEVIDTLWTKEGQYKLSSLRIQGFDKHGTGCHLSSAILANIALGNSLLESCKIAKNYMNAFINGGEGRLGNV